MQPPKDRRLCPRIPTGETLTVTWLDSSGAQYSAHARCLDVSETGLRIELPRRVDAGCYINVKSDKFKLNASAKVRNSIPKGLRYLIGLEFNSGWRWKNPGQ